jgi:S1-C subfamily serine protease
VAINGKLTPTNDAFMSIMENHKPGDRVEIQFVRGGKVQKRSLTLAAPPVNQP